MPLAANHYSYCKLKAAFSRIKAYRSCKKEGKYLTFK